MEKVKTFLLLYYQTPKESNYQRGSKDHYFEYWGKWVAMFSVFEKHQINFGEPVCMWLPFKYIKEGTSTYVQGAEVNLDYDGVIPEGFDVINCRKQLISCSRANRSKRKTIPKLLTKYGRPLLNTIRRLLDMSGIRQSENPT